MTLITRSFLHVATLMSVVGAGPAFAVTMTNNLGPLPATTVITGTLANESNVQLESFTLSSAEALTVFTTSYAGGMNLNGTTSPAGGFQPNIALFDTTGFTLAQTTGSYPGNSGDPKTGIVGDSYFMTSNLAAGSYILSISNWATTGDPISGFTNSGSGSGSFLDVGNNARTGSYAVNLSSTTATPEPASFWLTFPVALGIFGMWRKRRISARN